MRTELRPDLPALPRRMMGLPLSPKGYPVPWFVSWVDGLPEFRAVGSDKIMLAVRKHLCWICGQPTGRMLAFVIGPMCAVNRINSEPPSHRDCAEFAATACPFLTRPKAKRRETGMPEDAVPAAGDPILRNPGVTALWVCRDFHIKKAPGGFLFQMGEPTEVLWFTEGRGATRAEVDASMDSGLPLLREVAQREGEDAIRWLERSVGKVTALLPA